MPASIEDIAAGVHFVVDVRGNVTNVVLSPEAWQQLLALLEDAEDRAVLSKLAPKLVHGPRDALQWSDVDQEWA